VGDESETPQIRAARGVEFSLRLERMLNVRMRSRLLPTGFIEPCIPTPAHKPPTGPVWVHEIKHDGYRLIVCRRRGRVRLFTRSGYDWTERYPLIASAAAELACDATIDGEAVVCNDDGIADFERLHSRLYNGTAFLWAFDLLQLDGEDLRPRPLSERKDALRRLLRRARHGIQFLDHLEDDGSLVFDHVCRLGLEGIVSKDRTRPYRSGPSKTWLKIKNPDAPGVRRFEEEPT
jgi:bifunctional non-homologous end joining protein LigD